MSFGPGHVVVLLIVIALVVPTLLQMCDAPGSQSCARSTRSSTPPQWAAPGRSSPPLPGGLEADHPVLFLQQTHPRPQCTGRLQFIENIARAPVAPPARMPVSDRPGERLGTKEELGSADLDGSAANRPGGDVRCVRR